MSNGVSIVGYSCRLPGAANADEFWRLLSEGRCSVSQIPADRFATTRYIHPNRAVPGRSVNFFAGVLDDIFGFDAAFFGMSPREAVQTDPQQRLLLQVVWESLEHAGIAPSSMAGSPVGVFVGASSLDYQLRFVFDPLAMDTQSMTGNTLSIISNRISYQLDLKGPSFTVDTACSSSLVALNQACEAIASGTIDTAIVAGVNILGAPFPFIGFSRAFMLSANGRCSAFDADGDGYVRAEGAVAIVIQSTRAARRSKRRIHADIAGWGTNSDGKTVGLSMPSSESQFNLLEQVYRRFDLDPENLAFVEAHGTGTRVGDPAEAGAIGRSLGRRHKSPLLIGSVKTNIGHLEPASGMAGLLKALLSLKHNILPASLHFKTPNPDIPFEDLNLEVAASARSLQGGGQQLAGINSFGFGGSNAHVVLRQSQSTKSKPVAQKIAPLVLSARSPEALRAVAARLSAAIEHDDTPPLAAFISAAAYTRDHLENRAIIPPATREKMLSSLADLAGGRSSSAIVGKASLRNCKVAFAFSGNGSQWAGMGQAAMRLNPRFRQSLEEVDRIFSPLTGWSLIEVLHSEDLAQQLYTASVAQALLFAIQVGVVNGLKDFGIEPSVVFGHSAGEVAAAWASGALTLEQAVKVVHSRSTCQETGRGKGGMAAVVLSREEAEELFLREEYAGLEIAAVNTGRSITISGAHQELERFIKDARKRRVATRRLDVEYAYHSHFADPVEQELTAALKDLSCSPSKVPFVSSVYGRIVQGDRLNSTYWWKNVRSTVDFKGAIEAALATGAELFLEIGPSPVLTGYISDVTREVGATVGTISTLDRKEQEDNDPILSAAAKAFVHGANVSMPKLFGAPVHGDTELPLYPWQNVQYRVEQSSELITTMLEAVHPLLGATPRKGTSTYYNHIDTEVFPWLKDHQIESAVVFPGTAILEMALAAARDALGEGPLELRGCAIFRPLVLESGVIRETMVRVSPEESLIDLLSRPRGSEGEWVYHARTRFSRPPTPAAIAFPTRTIVRTAQPDEIYRMMEAFQFNYGPAFRRLKSVTLLDSQSSTVEFSDAPAAWPTFLLDPTVADSALHGTLFTLFAGADGLPDGRSFVPTRIESLRLYQAGRTVRSCRVEVSGKSTGSAIANITFLADDGSVVAEALGGRFTEIRLSTNEAPASYYRTLPVPLSLTSASSSPLCGIAPDGIMTVAFEQDVVTAEPARGDALLLIEAAARAIAYQAFKKRYGLTPFVLNEAASKLQLRPHLLPTVVRILQDLEADALVERDGDTWRLSSGPGLSPVPRLIEALLDCDPERAPEATYLSFLAAALPDILSADHELPSVGPSLAEALGSASAANTVYNKALSKVVASIARKWPAGQCFRILMVGPSDAAFFRAVSAAVPPEVGTITISDFRADRFDRMQAWFSEQRGITMVPWDRLTAEFASGFDLVVGAELLLQCRQPADVLSTIRGLISGGGSLVFVEPAPSIFVDLVSFARPLPAEEVAAAGAVNSLSSKESLTQLLANAGYPSAEIENLKSDQTDAFLVVARKDWVDDNIILLDTAKLSNRQISVLDCDGSEFGRLLEAELFDAGNRVGRLGHSVARLHENEKNGSATSGSKEIASTSPDEVILLATAANSDPSAWLLERCDTLMKTLKSFDGRTGSLWVIAPGAVQALTGSQAVRPESAALWGFARVASNEYSNVDIRLIDISPGLQLQEAVRRLVDEIVLRRKEKELVINEAGCFGLRVAQDEAAQAVAAGDEGEATSRLDIDGQGSLDRLKWRLVPRIAPSAGEVEIEVAATGVNFRDVMWSLGLLPSEALESGFAGPTIGMECAGVVTRVGSGVSRLSVGDRCVAFAPAAFAKHVVVSEFAVAKLPGGINLETAATIPVAFLTAYYSLKYLARLTKGETVLIHGGAGGVGLAAIQIAKWCGAVPIATAGSPEKQALLRTLGVEHVLHSRSLAFADEVMRITSGKGVNVVLNSVAGEAMERSIGCLSAFGRFIELGKRDFFADTRVGLRPFRDNLSYFGVDADQLLNGQAKLAQQLFAELLELFERGELTPLPYRVFDGADVTAAFRLMQQAGHVGKILVRPGTGQSYAPGKAPELVARRDGTYVIVGGFGGFGLALATRLVKRGARHIVLIGRSGAGADDAKQAIRGLRAQGATIYEEALDASDDAGLAALFDRLSREAPPVRGVFHAAMVLDDALIENLTAARIEPVLRAKIKTATLLDRLTRAMDLDCFVLFSSATTMLGNPGQASYVAANMFLESLAQQRCASGLPAVAIAWGAIADAGYLARTSHGSELLSKRLGKHALKVEEALDALEQILQRSQVDPSRAVMGFSRFDWSAITRQLPLASTPLLEFMRKEHLADIGHEVRGGALAEELGSMPPEKARAQVVEILSAEIGRILRIGAAQIDRDKPLSDIGLDSLMGVELRLSAEERLGIEVPLMSIGGAGSLNDLAGRIVKLLREKGTTTTTSDVANLIHIHSDTKDAEAGEMAAVAAAIEKREATIKRVF